MTRPTLTLVLSAVAAITTTTHAQHRDIVLEVHEDRIVTGTVVDETFEPARIFAATFGDSGCAPFTQDPGFAATAGTFANGSRLGWNAVAGLGVWNGAGFEPPGGETLEVSSLSQFFIVGDEPVEGFTLVVQSNGGFHKHLGFCMEACPNGCTPPEGSDPGVYLLELETYSTDDTVEASEPYWLVFDYLVEDDVFDEAFDWAVRNLLGGGCVADITNDGVVDVADILVVLAGWGNCPEECPADITNDGVADVADILAILAAWGVCP